MKRLGKRSLSKSSSLAVARSWCAAVCYCAVQYEIYKSAVSLATAMSDTTGG